jgi:hypothetical protein
MITITAARERASRVLAWVLDHRAHLTPVAVAIVIAAAAIRGTDVAAVAMCIALLMLTGWIYALTHTVQSLRDELDQAGDDADRAVRIAEATANHVAENEPAGTGRHARPSPPPSPRTAA